MLEVVDFIKSHDDWESLLANAPYFISVKRKNGLMLLKYGIGSDFSINIVRECRGLILDESNLSVVRYAFYKFGNYGESYVPDIDWATARVQDKIDGSLMSLYYANGKWCIATNGSIDAMSVKVVSMSNETDDDTTFGELFMKALHKQIPDANSFFESLDKDCTYTFELVSPQNRIVIDYPSEDIYHIATRNNKTLKELVSDIGIKKPKEYNIHSLNDCIEVASKFTDKEGFVVVDKDWNRVKVKSIWYLNAHHTVSGVLTSKALVKIYLSGDYEEYLSYFPGKKKDFDEVGRVLDSMHEEADAIIKSIFDEYGDDLDFSKIGPIVAKMNHPYAQYIFKNLKSHKLDFDEFFRNMPKSRVIDYVASKLKM